MMFSFSNEELYNAHVEYTKYRCPKCKKWANRQTSDDGKFGYVICCQKTYLVSLYGKDAGTLEGRG